jgi:hypothetical protein
LLDLSKKSSLIRMKRVPLMTEGQAMPPLPDWRFIIGGLLIGLIVALLFYVGAASTLP